MPALELSRGGEPLGGEAAVYYAANGTLPGEDLISDEELEDAWPLIDDSPIKPPKTDRDDDDGKKGGKEKKAKESDDNTAEARLRRIIDAWLTQGPSDDPAQLNETADRDGGVRSSPAGASVAAMWQRSHHWVNRLLAARDGIAGDDAGGAGLARLPFLGAGALSDLPQAAVGLKNVPGHELKTFRGIKEGLSVLG